VAERIARRSAVRFARWQKAKGRGLQEAANRLGMSPSSLGRWVRTWAKNRMAVGPRGRTLLRADRDNRREILASMTALGPRAGLPVLRDMHPDLPRRELEDLRRRWWRMERRRRRAVVRVLRWNRPGAVWAMDHAHPPVPIEGQYDRLLLVRDLPSSEQLEALPVEGEEAAPVEATLEAGFRNYGPPLVVKSDNGPFRAESIKDLCEQYGVKPLFSPPALPSYNGACEAGVGSIKTRSHHEAVRHDRAGLWTCNDVEAARCEANETARPWGQDGPTPAEVWTKRVPITDLERRMFQTSYKAYARAERLRRGIDPNAVLDHFLQARIDRVAIGRALVEHGYLEFRRRRVTPPILRTKQCKIA
jgi:hypothetical protein